MQEMQHPMRIFNTIKVYHLFQDTGRTVTLNFVNDKRDGQGIFIWADGRKYNGEWKAGK